MDLPDKKLDAWVEVSLQTGMSISPQQKQFAWERLSQQAMEQAILPAAMTLEEKSYLARFWEASSIVWRRFSAFAIEEERYERARRNRHLMRYQYISPNGEMAIQFLSPLRLSI
jgi:hypothetical protein